MNNVIAIVGIVAAVWLFRQFLRSLKMYKKGYGLRILDMSRGMQILRYRSPDKATDFDRLWLLINSVLDVLMSFGMALSAIMLIILNRQAGR